MNKKHLRLALVLVPAAILAACTAQQATAPNVGVVEHPMPQPLPPITSGQVQTPSTTPVQFSNFDEWKQSFIQRAIATGHSASQVQFMMANAQYIGNVVSLDRRQPEFSQMPWSYADSATSSSRVSGGRNGYQNQQALLDRLESQYGVPASIITAIWGMESGCGHAWGSTDLVSALSTLAYDGRRREFAEQQLIAMLTLVERGDVTWDNLKGSWAGGMGHTQFIPTTWIEHGVDGNNDGHKNPWNVTDALSSTASYLGRSGWVRGLQPYYEVQLPNGFDYRQSATKKTLAEWQALGVRFNQATPSGDTILELWLPAGYQGPALLTSRNFEVIRVYNNSSSYALGVSMLGRAIIGAPTLQASWPRQEQGLSSSQAMLLQQRLTALGFDTKGADGVIGNNTRAAFQRWQAANGQIADGFISQNSARSLLY
ncbi:lytic murein transglycosylase [Acinetobacter sp. c2-A9]|uniref:lytic murein transglycosylase n=1 Tax=Acinetobacter sp. c2-A9 TaxID=3342802 RepID=UPI0035BA36C4